ncbi:NosD domain-containing protein [Methanobrevibacter sp. V14]|uniref:NosD domain-containing protein n=1 Tax=Methanobrevibacter sp. V14 TaxID=3064280 RepID=UPI0027364C48|nr:NosD domain-containing protein [Methanobrevibacter sp. V14]
MGAHNIQVINNTFDGPVLDGVSIVSTSGDVLVENNTFINNAYAVFYGGASTKGSVIKNNKFITCGYLETSYYNNLKQWENNTYDNLPVISLKKSSDNLDIINNTFVLRENNLLIYSEAENEDHGFPSAIGSINMTGNTVETLNSSVNPASVTFYWLKVLKSLELNPTDDIIVKNNNIAEGIEVFHLEFAAIETNQKD